MTAVVADIRNKLNGSVFSKNRYGAYMRTKVTPVNPQTTYQQNNRALLAAASSGWRDLDAADREAWITAAPNFPMTDIFGNTKILSGQALFVGLTSNLINAGESQVSSAPTPVSIAAFSITAAVAANGGAKTITISPATIPAGFVMQVYATPSYPVGISFVKNKYRFVGNFTVTAA